jgi:hypothetical protein
MTAVKFVWRQTKHVISRLRLCSWIHIVCVILWNSSWCHIAVSGVEVIELTCEIKIKS